MIQKIGSGLSFRPAYNELIFENKDSIDCIEIIAEHFINLDVNDKIILDQLASHFPIIVHSLGLSLGSAFIDYNHISRLNALCDYIGVDSITDHLAITKVPGLEIGGLMPLQLNTDVQETVISNINTFTSLTGKQIVIENITTMFKVPGATLSFETFLKNILANTNANILLDITNLFINAYNYNRDPIKDLNSIPVDRIAQIHISGAEFQLEKFIDSHSEPVQEGTWKLLEHLAELIPIPCVILERDQNFTSFFEILEQLNRARSIIS